MAGSAISLFSGAGGMDVGMIEAGFLPVWANDINADACATYAANHNSKIEKGDLTDFLPQLRQHRGVDLVFGGPPCQGFSVAGKMDPHDPRSKLVFSFMEAVRIVRPKAFVFENVKALGLLEKWKPVRDRLIREADSLGYACALVVLKASNFGVPQARERMFLVGFHGPAGQAEMFEKLVQHHKQPSPILREVIIPLGRAGTATNSRVCKAKVTIAATPVLRKSPYAGMLFNGQGRPLNPFGYASTLPATMGGNRTPIVDEEHLFDGSPSWVEEYHSRLMAGGTPLPFEGAPERLRRLTVDEALLLQTFPSRYEFIGKQSSVFAQIGNAVPCKLAYAVGRTVQAILGNTVSRSILTEEPQFKLAV